jgi:hypothetical protein
MTALAKDTDVLRKGYPTLINYLVGANQTIYKGAIVMIDPATGYLIVGADTASCISVGIADEQVVSTTAGVKTCRVASGALFLLPTATIAITDVPDTLCVADSGSLALASVTTNDLKLGRVVYMVDTTHVWVWIPVTGPVAL